MDCTENVWGGDCLVLWKIERRARRYLRIRMVEIDLATKCIEAVVQDIDDRAIRLRAVKGSTVEIGAAFSPQGWTPCSACAPMLKLESSNEGVLWRVAL